MCRGGARGTLSAVEDEVMREVHASYIFNGWVICPLSLEPDRQHQVKIHIVAHNIDNDHVKRCHLDQKCTKKEHVLLDFPSSAVFRFWWVSFEFLFSI